MYCPIPVQRVHGGQLELFPNTPQHQTLFVVDLLDIALAWDGMQYILFFFWVNTALTSLHNIARRYPSQGLASIEIRRKRIARATPRLLTVCANQQ